jgi:5-methylcytosine-specific restriction endonuclease McrA
LKNSWYYKNHERAKRTQREYYLRNKKARIKRQKEYQKKTNRLKLWRDENSERLKMYQKEYRMKNKSLMHSSHKAWAQSEKGKQWIRSRNQNRRSKSKDLTRAIIQLVYESNIKLFGRLTCYLCEKPIEFRKSHLEHKTPISRGGGNNFDNLGVACGFCNISKHNQTVEEFLKNKRGCSQTISVSEQIAIGDDQNAR